MQIEEDDRNRFVADTSVTAAPAAVLPATRVATRVLLIEDDHDSRDGLRILLDAYGFETTAAETGEVGLAMISAQKPDLLLLDLGLPTIDGFELLDAIEGLEQMSTIVLSAWSPRRCEARALAAGASLYLQKPVSGSQLVEAIECVLAQRGD